MAKRFMLVVAAYMYEVFRAFPNEAVFGGVTGTF